MDLLELETVTTVPTVPFDHPALLDELMRMDREKRRKGIRRQRDPWWFVLMIYLGACLFIGAGAFSITIGVLR
jgi:hypothetical protein